MKVVIAIDSFKGSLTSKELALIIKKGIQRVYPEAECVHCLVADGGEGTVDALVEKKQQLSVEVHDALMRPIIAKYGILGKTAIIEMAAAAGLPQIEPDLRNPMLTSTYGVGELILDGLKHGCERFIIGLGGSATNDAGVGMLQALGFEFLKASGESIKLGAQELDEIASIKTDKVDKRLFQVNFEVACDVDNPLYGERGAAFIYAKQKGASDEMIVSLDKKLQAFANSVVCLCQKEVAHIKGVGAAGGMGAGFLAFLPARLRSGVEIILEEVALEKALEGACFVITGEGRLDAQSVMGKAPIGVAKLAQEHGVGVIALAGGIESKAQELLHKHGIHACFSIVSRPLELATAMQEAKALVEQQTYELFSLIKLARSKSF